MGPQMKNIRFQEISKDWSLKENSKVGRPSGIQFQVESLYYTFVQNVTGKDVNITKY